MHTGVEQGPFVPRHSGSMIGEKENYCILRQSILFQLPEDFAHFFIHCGYTVVKAGHSLTYHRSVRVIRRDSDFSRIVNLIVA